MDIRIASVSVSIILLLGVWVFVNIDESDIEVSAIDITSEDKTVLEDISIIGRAGIVLDVDNDDILYSKNEFIPFPIASITKIFSVLTAFEYISRDEIITISQSDKDVEGESGLIVGDRWNAYDLAGFSLIISSNDGISALARKTEEVFADRTGAIIPFHNIMNQYVEDQGLIQTRFFNPSGLDQTPVFAGAYSSSYEVALILSKFLREHPNLAEITTEKEHDFVSENGNEYTLGNTNIIAQEIPFLLASKTGFTDLANGNLAVVTSNGPTGALVSVVLGSTEEDRFTDIKRLIEKIVQGSSNNNI